MTNFSSKLLQIEGKRYPEKKQKIIQNLNKKNKNCFKPNKYIK